MPPWDHGKNRPRQAKKKHNKRRRKQYKGKHKRKDKTPEKSHETHVSSVSSVPEEKEVDLASTASGSQALFEIAMAQSRVATSTLAELNADLQRRSEQDELCVWALYGLTFLDEMPENTFVRISLHASR